MGLFNKFSKKPEVAPASSRPASASKILKVSDFLTVKNISFFTAGPSKQQVLGGLIGSLDLPDPSAALKAILAREEAGSTTIAPGLALPHARISGIAHITAALGICPSGVSDSRTEGDPINVFVLFLGPAENMKEHLAFLASVSSLFQTEGLIASLTSLTTAEAVLARIHEAEKAL